MPSNLSATRGTTEKGESKTSWEDSAQFFKTIAIPIVDVACKSRSILPTNNGHNAKYSILHSKFFNQEVLSDKISDFITIFEIYRNGNQVSG